MTKDFCKTPSFYNSQEVFKKFLGQSSYYLALQQGLIKLIKITNSKKLLELGFGTGQTAITVAKNVAAKITAVDMRQEMVGVGNNLAKENNVENIHFMSGDMTEFVTNDLQNFDFIYMIYSFHHIEDPLQNKIVFLQNCYNNMSAGAYLCVGETFIAEVNAMDGTDSGVLNFFEKRGAEGYASTFWKSLNGLSKDDIDYANEVASYCGQMEINAGKLVAIRNNEYLVKRSWLVNHAKKIGFEVVIDKQVNTIGDAIILLKKV
ncbi:MAG: class I SAM-dependent methyltransferase [Clostridiales bacterium]|nr:class I SAM-dependent methyltransferase [Clostridiales bacterium]